MSAENDVSREYAAATCDLSRGSLAGGPLPRRGSTRNSKDTTTGLDPTAFGGTPGTGDSVEKSSSYREMFSERKKSEIWA
jgi:hypothetical protein